MDTFYGRYEFIRRKHRRGEFGTHMVCMTDVICKGKYVDSCIEVKRPADMWRLGLNIQHHQWLAWEAKDIGDTPANIRFSEPPENAEQLIENGLVHVRKPDEPSVSDMFTEGFRGYADAEDYTNNNFVFPQKHKAVQ